METHAAQTEPGPSKASSKAPSLGHLRDRRFPAALGLGFSSGIPFLLVYFTQSAWLSEAKVPIETLGLLSELTIAYKLKWVWAPFLDRHDPPLLGRLLGRRRGWIVAAQILVAATLAGIAFGDPGHFLAWTVAFSLALGFAGATQDTVIDGWRIAVAPNEQQATLASWAEVGWRVGNLAAGAGALLLSDRIGWRGAYLCMAVLMLPGMAAALLAPVPPSDVPPSDVARADVTRADVTRADRIGAARGTRPAARLGWREFVATVWTPIRELMGRLGPMAVPILLLVAGFRMPGYVSGAMSVPLFKSLDYSDTDIATVTKLVAFWIALGGTFLAGWLVPRIGMMASLLVGTVFGSASHLALAYLAAHGEHGVAGWTFAVTVSIDNFAYAFASIVLITYMSQLASAEHAASQYALLTSLCALPGSLIAGFSGFLVERLGFEWFFVATSLIGVPVALLAWWVWHVQRRRGVEYAG